MGETIGEILREQARTRPETVAIVDSRGSTGRRLTYAQLEREVAVAAGWLQSHGLRKGDAVLVFVPMSADLYVALLAMFRLGVVALFLDPSAGRQHIEQCCARWAPDALLAIPRAHLLRLRSAALRRIPLKIVTSGWVPRAARWLAGGVDVNADAGAGDEIEPADAALVTFTSGSTGVPKAAVRTHGFLVAQHRVLEPGIVLEPGEVDLATLPIFTLANLASGVTTVIPDVDLRRPGNVDAARLRQQIERFGVTRITASPAFFERLIEHGGTKNRTLPTLRKLHTGGAPVFPRMLSGLRTLAPNAHVVAVYGSTEAEPIAHLAVGEITPEELVAMQNGRGLLTGAPVAEITLRVIRDRWGTPRGVMTERELVDETLPPGEAGEIVVTGEHVLRGYLGGMGDEETKFRVDGTVWHRTGDAGLLDSGGRLWLLGRCAARIDDGHGRFHPFAVECVAMNFPEVRRAALLAHGGKRWLVVEARGDRHALEAQLLAATRWAHIGEVRFVETMPVDKRHNAKVDYPGLRRMLGIE
ncbi:MAG: AMP-binding protein [Opitutaceae bacterium]